MCSNLRRAIPRVLLVDDHEPFRSFVRSFIEGHAQLSGEAEDGSIAVQKCVETRPDVVLLDIGLPAMNGMQVARRIQQLVPSCRIIFLTQENSAEIVEEAFRLGAAGYVIKSRASSDLIPAMVAAQNGRYFVGSGVEHSSTVGLLVSNFNGAAKGQTIPSAHTPAAHHYVGFYHEDASLVSAFAEFIKRALKDGKAVLSILKDAHCDEVFRSLHAGGIAVNDAIAAQRLAVVKVEPFIAEFMLEERADLEHLSHLAVGTLEDLRKANPHATISACGECAPTLLERGKPEVSLQVERAFDEVIKRYEIQLFCGYILNGLQLAQHMPIYQSICSEHS